MSGNKEGAKKFDEKYGTDFRKRITIMGGKQRTGGYFGYLKATGQEDKLKELAKKAAIKSAETKKRNKAIKDSERNPVLD